MGTGPGQKQGLVYQPFLAYWWSQPGSNRRPLACHASALPAELWPHAWEARTLRQRDTSVKTVDLLPRIVALDVFDGARDSSQCPLAADQL